MSGGEAQRENNLASTAAAMLTKPNAQQKTSEKERTLGIRLPTAKKAAPVPARPVKVVPPLPAETSHDPESATSGESAAERATSSSTPSTPSTHVTATHQASIEPRGLVEARRGASSEAETEELSDAESAREVPQQPPMALVRPQTDPERGRGRPRRAELDEFGNVVPRTGRVETSVTMPSGLRDQWFGYASAQSFSKSEVLMDAFDLVVDDLADLAAAERTRVQPAPRRGSMFYRPPAPGEKGAHALVSAPLRLHATNLEVIDRLAAEHQLNRSQLVSLVLREFFVRNNA